MTVGVNVLPLDTKARVLLAVQSSSTFTKDNDPHREHDFGSSRSRAKPTSSKSTCMKSQKSRTQMESPSSIVC